MPVEENAIRKEYFCSYACDDAATDRKKIVVKFPWQLGYGRQSWSFIIETTEVFFRYHGMQAFAIPAEVTDFVIEPAINEELKSDFIRHISVAHPQTVS